MTRTSEVAAISASAMGANGIVSIGLFAPSPLRLFAGHRQLARLFAGQENKHSSSSLRRRDGEHSCSLPGGQDGMLDCKCISVLICWRDDECSSLLLRENDDSSTGTAMESAVPTAAGVMASTASSSFASAM